jgi:hypothetical protein
MSKKTGPWLLGLIEALKCVALIKSSNLQTRNRLALLMLDSTLEIGIRQYLVNVKKIILDDKQHRHRDTLMRIAKNNIKLEEEVWDHLSYFWNTRNPQYHQEANVVVTDAVYEEFQDIVVHILKLIYNLDAAQYLSSDLNAMFSGTGEKITLDTKKIKSKVDLVISAVATNDVKNPEDLKQALRKIGITKKISDDEARVYLNSKYFYKDENGNRKLSHSGLKKWSSILTNSKLGGIL